MRNYFKLLVDVGSAVDLADFSDARALNLNNLVVFNEGRLYDGSSGVCNGSVFYKCVLNPSDTFDVSFLECSSEKDLFDARNFIPRRAQKLRNALSNTDFSFVRFEEGMELQSNLLTNSRFYKSRFSKVNLTDVSFKNSEITNSEFEQSVLKNVNFFNAKLENVTFNKCVMRRVLSNNVNIFDSCALNFSESRVLFLVPGVKISREDFSAVDMSEVDLTSAKMESCVFSAARFDRSNLHAATFKKCSLSTTKFLCSNLSDVKFINCTGMYVDFSGANLQGVDVSLCKFIEPCVDRALYNRKTKGFSQSLLSRMICVD